MKHDAAWQRLPDLLVERSGESELRRHVARCHACQRQLFLLQRVDALFRSQPPAWEPRRRPSRLRGIFGLVVAGAAAAALGLGLFLPRSENQELTFRSAAAPRVVVHGSVSPGDAANAVLTIVAQGLPREGGSANFLVWARTASGEGRVLVGRFMANPSGECRARFNLPDDRRWTQFWITPESSPTTVVAATVL